MSLQFKRNLNQCHINDDTADVMHEGSTMRSPLLWASSCNSTKHCTAQRYITRQCATLHATTRQCTPRLPTALEHALLHASMHNYVSLTRHLDVSLAINVTLCRSLTTRGRCMTAGIWSWRNVSWRDSLIMILSRRRAIKMANWGFHGACAQQLQAIFHTLYFTSKSCRISKKIVALTRTGSVSCCFPCVQRWPERKQNQPIDELTSDWAAASSHHSQRWQNPFRASKQNPGRESVLFLATCQSRRFLKAHGHA